MFWSYRPLVILCCLLLAAMSFATPSALANQPTRGPVLSAVNMASPFGVVSVSGSGFTPGGLVRLIVHDLDDAGPTIDTWTVAAGGEVSIDLPYLTATTYGPHGSQDPAQGHVQGTVDNAAARLIFGPNGSQDPAQGYVPATHDWPDGCPELLVHALDVRAAQWSNSLDVQVANC